MVIDAAITNFLLASLSPIAKIKNMNAIKLETCDGQTIPVFYYPAKRPRNLPILFVHGFAAKASMWSSPLIALDWGRYFSSHGHPVYKIELRGRQPGSKKMWDLDHYIRGDLQAAVSMIINLSQNMVLI